MAPGDRTTYVYKLAAAEAEAAGSPRLQPTMAPPEVVKRTILSRSYWGLSKQSKVTNRRKEAEEEAESGKKGNVVISRGRRSDVHAVRVAEEETRKPAVETRRRSVSHVEVMASAAAVANGLRVKVLVTDMPGFMQVHAFRCARKSYDSLESFSSKQMAHTIKKEFDKVYGASWHCIVGSSFGSFVTHSTGCFLYFSMENLYLLIFRTKLQINPPPPPPPSPS